MKFKYICICLQHSYDMLKTYNDQNCCSKAWRMGQTEGSVVAGGAESPYYYYYRVHRPPPLPCTQEVLQVKRARCIIIYGICGISRYSRTGIMALRIIHDREAPLAHAKRKTNRKTSRASGGGIIYRYIWCVYIRVHRYVYTLLWHEVWIGTCDFRHGAHFRCSRYNIMATKVASGRGWWGCVKTHGARLRTTSDRV